MSQRPTSSHRVESIDLLRGLVMVLMVLDHVRDFMGVAQPPERMAEPGAALFLTRFVTHFCAPVFILLAGVAAYFSGLHKPGTRQLSRFLLTRGLWLVFLDLTVLFYGWMFVLPFAQLVLLQVIWVIGWSMVILAALVWLPRWAILAVCLPVVFCHDFLSRLEIDLAIWKIELPNAVTGVTDQLWCLLHAPFALLAFSPDAPVVLVIYALIPWFAVMAVGYAMGPLLRDPGTRFRNCMWLGTLTTAAFVVLRFAFPALDLHFPFGEPGEHAVPHAGEPGGLIDFVNTNKYPPSLMFLLMTLGPGFLVIAAFERLRGRLVDWLLVFGRVPLFFYIAHVYLAHVIGMIWVRAQCGVWFVNVAMTPPSDPPGLLEIYAVWFLVVLTLYPVCRWFMRLKRRRRDLRWLSYL